VPEIVSISKATVPPAPPPPPPSIPPVGVATSSPEASIVNPFPTMCFA